MLANTDNLLGFSSDLIVISDQSSPYSSVLSRLISKEKLRLALDFLDDLAEEIDLAQRRLDEVMVKLARQNGYDEDYWGSRLDLSQLSPDEFLELKEEMRLVVTETAPSLKDDPVDEPLIFQPLSQPCSIHQSPPH